MKNLFRKTSKETTPKALKINCTKETKEQVSSIMKKYGWTWNEFESFIEKESLELNMEKVLEDKFSINNINFSNEDETEKTIFFQVNDTVLEILIIQGNQIITLDIEKKKEKKDKMEEAVLKKEKKVLNGRIITTDIEENKIRIEVRIGEKIIYNIKIVDDRYSTSRVIKLIKIKINNLFDIIAHSKEKEMGSNLIEEIEELLKNSNISESEFMTVKVQKQMEEVDRKIIFKTIRRQHLRTDTVKVQNSKEELEYYIHDKLWIYTNKKVILKGCEDSSTYDATFTEDAIESLEKNIKRAKKIVEEIKSWK